MFLENQDKVTFGLAYKLILTRSKDQTVIDKGRGFGDARNRNDHIHWYVPHYTPSIQQQGISSEQIINKTPTELRYIEWPVFMKEMNNRNLWTFELAAQESMDVFIWNIIGVQRRDGQDSQNLKNNTFCRLAVTSAQCNIGIKKYPDAGILLNYDDDDYSHGYGQIDEAFRAITKDVTLQPYVLLDKFWSSNARTDEVEYNSFILDISYQQNLSASQPVKVEYKFDGLVPKDINGYGSVLTNQWVSIGSDRQTHFHLNSVTLNFFYDSIFFFHC